MSEDNGKQLGILASITAAVEATRTEISCIQIQSTAETYEAHLQITIPVNQANNLDRAQITSEQAEFIDNYLQFDLTIEIASVGQDNLSTPRSVSSDQNQNDSRLNGSKEDRNQSSERSTLPTQSDEVAGQSKESENVDASSDEAQSEQLEAQSATQETGDTTDQGELREYQDPERLTAVYDENATFEEMRDELGVDVTAQTVRKYMIKHEIHNPEPRPDRLLETIRVSELELMNSKKENRSSPEDASTDPDTDSS